MPLRARTVTTRCLHASFVIQDQRLEIRCDGVEIDAPHHALFVALGAPHGPGAAVVPFSRGVEGSTVFLPFRANRLIRIDLPPSQSSWTCRTFGQTLWSEPRVGTDFVRVEPRRDSLRCSINLRGLGPTVLCAAYAKDLTANDGWGRLIALSGDRTHGVTGDCCVNSYYCITPERSALHRILHRLPGERIRIYQVLPRLFGNLNEQRKPNGTIHENGVGKFADINAAALRSLRALGFTHIWLTGILRQLSATAHPEIGHQADDPDLLKGLAGSPYAIKDYFDVCADYALDPAQRVVELQALIRRIHEHGLRVIIDFIPNHVARSYDSRARPDLNFGNTDDRRKFFDARNNFFYVHDVGGVRLPSWKEGRPISATCKVLGTCDGRYDGEQSFTRVTGNNVASAEPKLHDWYETVKLNYGFNFMENSRAYPCSEEPNVPVPDTWIKMDAVLAHWQRMQIDGFRCDMAHMVPAEFWGWAISRARARNPQTLFIAEAYDNDPMKVPCADPLLAALNDHKGNVMFDLLNAGFTAVYDDPSYKKLKAIYDGYAWANDLDGAHPHDFIFQNSLRYAENHDEVRLASRDHWGNAGMNVGRPVAAILYALSRGPILVYSGQEVGEPAAGPAGFAGDDGRTTIFDYWSMPELLKWANGHRYDGAKLSEEQKALRAFYGRLLHAANEPAFRDGEFFPLNAANVDNARFGRIAGESASGHWLLAFLRYDPNTQQRVLVVANLHRSELLHDVRIRVPSEARQFLSL
ncbi:MAG TPA: alpha-amylase family glycosyl hydrolase, partial [Chthoniobacteraceae bacterium]|nr:alpha-amylase family glycosyl hydrolase [Chthoniobacteraceae bacterium]